MIEGLTLSKIVSLGIADSVNPCTLGILSMMLVAILMYNPKKKRNVLLAGLAFTTSVYFMYLLYGLVIVKFFQIAQFLTIISSWLYKILGFGAIVLGILDLKNFIQNKAACTVIPKVGDRLKNITSPTGAFAIGAFVTIFLLPCTIGPYIILTGMLSFFEIIVALPWLMFYNLIFVLPMLAITVIVFAGLSTIEDVTAWQTRNMRYLTLISGLVMLVLGVALVMGWI